MRLAVIPARGGSKRIPRKNVKEFCGKPMIAWSIQAARASGCFDRIVVSTDDEEIATVARQYGAETPFMRPAELSDDYTGTIPVIAHAIETLANNGEEFEAVCCLYATAPFVEGAYLRQGYDILISSSAQFAFSVTTYAFPIQRALRLTEDGRVTMFHPEHFSTRSQDLEEALHDAGQFYWGIPDAWLSQNTIFSASAMPVILPRYCVQDIDTPEDWHHAELLYQALHKAKVSGQIPGQRP